MLCESVCVRKWCYPHFLSANPVVKRATQLLIASALWAAFATRLPIANAQTWASETAIGSMSGTVLSQGSNQPIVQAMVTLRSQNEGISRTVLTDFAGQFEIQRIPSGEYVISIEQPGYEPFTANESVRGTTANLLLYLVTARSQTAKNLGSTVSLRELKIPHKAQTDFIKGLERLAKSDWQASLEHFSKATQAFSGYYEAFYHMGYVQLRLGQKEEAMQSFQHAIDLSGGHYVRAQFGMGYALCLEGKLSEAEKVIREGVETDGNVPEGHALLGMLQMQLNQLDAAERSENEALMLNPTFAQAYFVLSQVYEKKHEYRKQLQGLESYLKLLPAGPVKEIAQRMRDNTRKLVVETNPQD